MNLVKIGNPHHDIGDPLDRHKRQHFGSMVAIQCAKHNRADLRMLMFQNHRHGFGIHPLQGIHTFEVFTLQDAIGHPRTFGLTQGAIQG